MREIKEIRQPIVEGLFYPDDITQCDNKIETLLRDNPSTKYHSRSIIIPHGGWDICGNYIAKGFNSLKRTDFNRVIIVSNVHREKCDNIPLSEYNFYLGMFSDCHKAMLEAFKLHPNSDGCPICCPECCKLNY